MVLFCCWSVAQSCLTLLQPHGLQHARPLCPSPSPRVCPSSCPLHWWYHPAISSSDTLFSCFQSFLASGTFPMSRMFASGDQYTEVVYLLLIIVLKKSVYWIDNLFIYLLQMLYMLSWLIFGTGIDHHLIYWKVLLYCGCGKHFSFFSFIFISWRLITLQ